MLPPLTTLLQEIEETSSWIPSSRLSGGEIACFTRRVRRSLLCNLGELPSRSLSIIPQHEY